MNKGEIAEAIKICDAATAEWPSKVLVVDYFKEGGDSGVLRMPTPEHEFHSEAQEDIAREKARADMLFASMARTALPRALARIEVLSAALEFYADVDHFPLWSGDRARAALRDIK